MLLYGGGVGVKKVVWTKDKVVEVKTVEEVGLEGSCWEYPIKR